MLFSKFCDNLERISSTKKRLEITQFLSELFKEFPEESGTVSFLVQGKIAPDYEGIELGVSEKSMIKILSGLSDKTEEDIFKAFAKTGDLGEVVFEVLGKSKQTTFFMEELTVEEVFRLLKEIAMKKGSGSSEIKEALIKNMFIRSNNIEAKYLTKIILGKLRLGVSDATIISSLRIAFRPDLEQSSIEDTYNFHPDVSYLAEILRSGKSLENLGPTPFIPMNVMLAERLPSLNLIIEKLNGKASFEFKYDGLRLQIHKVGEKVKTFSRGREDTTSQFPEIIEAVKQMKVESVILDGEAVPMNLETEEIYPFQNISRRRGRKYSMEKMQEEIPIVAFLFDIVYLNGKQLNRIPYIERKKTLEMTIKDSERLKLASQIITESESEAEAFFESSVSSGCEGIVAKSVDDNSIYRAGSRGWLWIKFKRDYRTEINDTLDLAVIGAFHGHGRRKGFYGALLLASYNGERDMFESVCKLGSGFTDENLEELRPMFSSMVAKEKPNNVDSEMKPDVWIYPEKVIEIKGAEITSSPIHKCARDLNGSKGLAVRFPRFTGNWRNDKKNSECTTSSEVFELFKMQQKTSYKDESN